MSVAERTIAATPTRREVRQHEQRILFAVLLLTDAGVIAISFAFSYIIRFWLKLPFFDEGTINPAFYVFVISMLLPTFLAIFHVYGLYDRANLLGGTAEYARLFNALAAGLVFVMFINFLQPQFVVARGWIMVAWVLMVVLGMLNRFSVRRLIYWQRSKNRFLDRTLVVGANPEGLAVAEQLANSPLSGAQIVGFVDDYLPFGFEPLPGIPVLGSSGAFSGVVDGQVIDTVVIANTAITRERLLSIYSALETLQDVEVRMASGLFEMLTTSMRVREEGYVPLVVLNKTRITGIHWFCKTLLDYTLAATALLLLSPLFLVMAILIKRDSNGPVFYRRRVVGQGKREFDAFKFRTMRIEGNKLLSADELRELEEYGKLKHDPRVTKIGTFLRRYSLDELPQLFNVLLGEMSLIGPRMITLPELEKFGKWQHNLATVKPGLTGLWQVSGRSDLSYEERVRLDMHYIRNHSIWLDLQILFQTIPALLTGRGAY